MPPEGKLAAVCEIAGNKAAVRKWFITGPDIETVRELLQQEARQYTTGPDGPAILFMTRVTSA